MESLRDVDFFWIPHQVRDDIGEDTNFFEKSVFCKSLRVKCLRNRRKCLVRFQRGFLRFLFPITVLFLPDRTYSMYLGTPPFGGKATPCTRKKLRAKILKFF